MRTRHLDRGFIEVLDGPARLRVFRFRCAPVISIAASLRCWMAQRGLGFKD